jgi:hypothetical protein
LALNNGPIGILPRQPSHSKAKTGSVQPAIVRSRKPDLPRVKAIREIWLSLTAVPLAVRQIVRTGLQCRLSFTGNYWKFAK